MTTVRLAWGGSEKMLLRTLAPGVNRRPPALLVSYVYLSSFTRIQDRVSYRDWVMDSGAFTANNIGMHIDLQQYTDTCAGLLEKDPTLTEVFALDVIGDWEAGARNAEEMVRQGVPAIPCYHHGEPLDLLLEYAAKYPKIAFGGVAQGIAAKHKREWSEQCMARVWPKRVHAFGFGSFDTLVHVPFHSCDASNWEKGPLRFGNWQSLRGTKLRANLRGGDQNLAWEVAHYLNMEDKLQHRWARQMAELEAL